LREDTAAPLVSRIFQELLSLLIAGLGELGKNSPSGPWLKVRGKKRPEANEAKTRDEL
jgi:hypothetical protein